MVSTLQMGKLRHRVTAQRRNLQGGMAVLGMDWRTPEQLWCKIPGPSRILKILPSSGCSPVTFPFVPGSTGPSPFPYLFFSSQLKFLCLGPTEHHKSVN